MWYLCTKMGPKCENPTRPGASVLSDCQNDIDMGQQKARETSRVVPNRRVKTCDDIVFLVNIFKIIELVEVTPTFS